jgi:glucose/arabinose dehydrogenase
VEGGALLPQPFVKLSVDSSGERGLIGVTVDPGFPGRPFVYVHYTVPGSPAHNRVSRFTANGDVAVPGSEHVVVDLPPLSSATNHNGGAIHFAPDGTLLIGVGENANPPRSQQLDNPFGKILRVDPTSGAAPSTNPFFSTAGADQRVWAYGLRNPFTFAFQPGTGRLYINDVGQSTFEEIDEGFRDGLNFGWPTTEGPTSNPAFTTPVFFYGHGTSDTTGCAIAGATFYNPVSPAFGADYVGDYFFADLCSGWIRRMDVATKQVSPFVPLNGVDGPVDLLTTPGGALLYLAHNSGVLGRIAREQSWNLRTTNTPGPPTIQAAVGSIGQSVACDWDGNGTDTPGVFVDGTWYLWNDFNGGPPFATIAYGTPGDVPVCGNWDGKEGDSIGVFELGHFFLRNSNTAGAPDISVHYGTPGDAVVVGDWNKDGEDTIGTYEFNHFYLRNNNMPGSPDIDIFYGGPGSIPLAGNWDGAGGDTIGVYAFNHFYLRNSLNGGPPNLDIFYGGPVDRPVPGDFDGGAHVDTVGVVTPA